MTVSSGLSQLRRGVLESCVLALVNGEPRYGYDLATELSEAGLIASEGTLYPLLSRLRKEGMVETTWQESSGGPPRRYYSLTPRGSQALVDFRHSWRDFTRSVEAILEGPTT